MEQLILNNEYLISDLNKIVYMYSRPFLDDTIQIELKIKYIFLLFNSINKQWKSSDINMSFADYILINNNTYFDKEECSRLINILDNCNCCKYHINKCSNTNTFKHICLCYSKQIQNILVYINNNN